MNVADGVTHPADIAYVKQHFVPLSERDPARPGPSYVLGDGTWYVPADYFEQEIDRERFAERYVRKAKDLGLDSPDALAREAWEEFLTGIYGVCLRSVTPENIALKHALIAEIDLLLERPMPQSDRWRAALREAVDALDELEMPFSPIYDRERFGRPPTRDTHIEAVRAQYLR